jgi:hypothetical protein
MSNKEEASEWFKEIYKKGLNQNILKVEAEILDEERIKMSGMAGDKFRVLKADN